MHGACDLSRSLTDPEGHRWCCTEYQTGWGRPSGWEDLGRAQHFPAPGALGGGRDLLYFSFRQAGGGGGSPLDPLPPSPLSSSAPENLGFGNFFQSWEKFRRFWRMPYTVYVLLHVCSIYLVLQTTMPQRSLSVYFSSPVQSSPRAKREDVIDALLYFRFKDKITGWKRPKAYNEAQKACATLFWSVPMATLWLKAVTQVRHHHQVLVPVPLLMDAPVQASLILTDHCHLT